MKDLFKLKREFLEYCEIEKGQSFLTIDNYDRYLTRFLTWLENEIKSETLNNKKSHSRSSRESTIVDPRVKPEDDKQRGPLRTKDYKLLPKMIDKEMIRKYRLHVNRLRSQDGGELKASTQNHHILALRAFLRYLSLSGEKTISPETLTLAKTGDREVSFLNREEYKRLLDAPDASAINGLRDEAMLEMLFSTGLRVSELTGLKLGQINFEKGEIAVLGKGKKLRVVFISDVAKKYLVLYLEKRGILKSQIINRPPAALQQLRAGKLQTNSKLETINHQTSHQEGPDTQPACNVVATAGRCVIPDTSKDEPVFLSNRKRKLNARAVERLVQKYSKIAGITKNVTPHTLRHTFATDLLSAGADIRSVQSLLGHANISTTQVYTHVTDKHLREIHQRYHDQRRSSEDTTTDHFHRSKPINPREEDEQGIS